MARVLAVLAIVFSAAIGACAPPSTGGGNPAGDRVLVLVSFDGWRWDYGKLAPTPNLDALAARGVAAESLVPVFPPKTFPNHYSIVTGLYPEHHGIIGNVMEDATIGERFTLSAPTAKDPRWWSGEPLWTTVERQGKRAASMFWPGSEVPINGDQPTWWFPFDESLANARRVAQVLEWLALPDAERPHFITLYFSDADTAGHDHGPESAQTAAAVETLDRLLGDLIDGISRLKMTDRTIVAVVSDHGMSQVSPDRVILLDDYIDPSSLTVVDWSPVLMLSPPADQVDAVYNALAGRHPALAVYRREEIPERLHYRNHARITPIVGIAADGWTITTRARAARNGAARELSGGAHGYEPANRSMHGLFVAAGPRLRQGYRAASFENVHLYELFCALLDLTPAPNDGDAAITRPFLTP